MKGWGVLYMPGIFYLCSMEDMYLYPGNDIRPIEIGEDYRDYRLSGVLANAGYTLRWSRAWWKGEPTEGEKTNEKIASQRGMWCFLVVSEGRSGEMFVSAIAPLYYHDRLSDVRISPLLPYDDLRIRYYVNDVRATRPVWTSAFDGSMEVSGGTDVIGYASDIYDSPILVPADVYVSWDKYMESRLIR